MSRTLPNKIVDTGNISHPSSFRVQFHDLSDLLVVWHHTVYLGYQLSLQSR